MTWPVGTGHRSIFKNRLWDKRPGPDRTSDTHRGLAPALRVDSASDSWRIGDCGSIMAWRFQPVSGSCNELSRSWLMQLTGLNALTFDPAYAYVA